MNFYSHETKEVKSEFLQKTLKFVANLLRILFILMLFVGFKLLDNSYIFVGFFLFTVSFVVSYISHRQSYHIKVEFNQGIIKEIRVYKQISTKVLRTFYVSDMTNLKFNTKTSLLYFEIKEINAKIYCDKYMMYLITETKMKGANYE